MRAHITPVNGENVMDSELEELAREALLRYGTLRIWGHALQIDATDGVIQLTGHVRTRTSKETAERVIRSVAGVRNVDNRLWVDTDLEIATARALAENPVTAGSFPGILVGSAFGEILLKGHVASNEIRQAAEEIAAQVPGVRMVTNQLATPAPVAPDMPAEPSTASVSD